MGEETPSFWDSVVDPWANNSINNQPHSMKAWYDRHLDKYGDIEIHLPKAAPEATDHEELIMDYFNGMLAKEKMFADGNKLRLEPGDVQWSADDGRFNLYWLELKMKEGVERETQEGGYWYTNNFQLGTLCGLCVDRAPDHSHVENKIHAEGKMNDIISSKEEDGLTEYFIELEDAHKFLGIQPTEDMKSEAMAALTKRAEIAGKAAAELAALEAELAEEGIEPLDPETDTDYVINYLNQTLEEEGILIDGQKFDNTNIKWDPEHKDFNIEGFDQLVKGNWEDILYNKNKTHKEGLLNMLEDRKINAEEFHVFKMGEPDGLFMIEVGDQEFTIEFWHLTLCGMLLLIVGGAIWWMCRPDTTPAPDDDPEFVGIQYRRRLCETPVVRLAREIGIDIPSAKVAHRVLTEEVHSPSIVDEVSERIGIAEKDLVWFISASCLCQVLWFYVSHKIYKRCRRNRKVAPS